MESARALASYHGVANPPRRTQCHTIVASKPPFRLPTDDHAYEARKERERELEEERKGAAAALSHNEFMYI